MNDDSPPIRYQLDRYTLILFAVAVVFVMGAFASLLTQRGRQAELLEPPRYRSGADPETVVYNAYVAAQHQDEDSLADLYDAEVWAEFEREDDEFHYENLAMPYFPRPIRGLRVLSVNMDEEEATARAHVALYSLAERGGFLDIQTLKVDEVWVELKEVEGVWKLAAALPANRW